MTDIAAIGFHGQTTSRAPPKLTGNTRQLGDGALMAARTGTKVVYDFRGADMAEGGQGAPLCPVYHAALLTRHGSGLTAVLVLAGSAISPGVAARESLSVSTPDPPTPPSTTDPASRRRDHDSGGKMPLRACRQIEAVAAARTSLFQSPFPKSLDRLVASSMADGLSLEDGAALLGVCRRCRGKGDRKPAGKDIEPHPVRWRSS